MMGSNRREEGSVMVKNSNVFAALDTLRKKKKSDKDKSNKGSSKEPEVLWAPAPLTVKSWADVDDEDDDDYYATTAPLQSFLGSNKSQKKQPEPVEETESENDLDEDVEEDNDHESEVPEKAEPVSQKTEASPAPKEAERQLSKKERKKKELAELEALLADFGVEPKEKGPDNLPVTDGVDEKKDGQQAEDMETKIGGTTKPKSAKKKKKKDKAKEVKESEDQPNNVDATIQPEETGGAEQVEDASTVDVKERLKRLASAKKKKSGKETAAKAAAVEAAARSAKLAAAKKKEKSHYNQQPMR